SGGGDGSSTTSKSGVLDSTFGTDGKLVVAAPSPEQGGGYTAFGAGSDGSVVLASKDSVLKLDRSGQPVASFGTSGPASVPCPAATTLPPKCTAAAIAEDASGNVYVLVFDDASTVTRLLKFDPAGNPAQSFGTAGQFSFASIIPNYAPPGMGLLAFDAAGNIY